MLRRFALVRETDHSGVSGTGIVAYGVQFSDEHVVVRWNSGSPSTSLWDSIEELLTVHGHNGATIVRWIDEEVPQVPQMVFPRNGTSPEARHRDASRRFPGRHRGN